MQKVSLVELKKILGEIFSFPVDIDFNTMGKLDVYYNHVNILTIREFPDEFYISYLEDFNENEHRIYLQIILKYFKQNNLKYRITNKSFFKSRNLFDKIFKSKKVKIESNNEYGNCPETIDYFYSILKEGNFDYRNGILIFFNSKFLGIYKQNPLGNSLLLNLENELFEKFALITFNKRLIEKLDECFIINSKSWNRVNLIGESLKINMDKDSQFKFINNVKNLKLSEFSSSDKEKNISDFTVYRHFILECDKLYNIESKYSGKFNFDIKLDLLN